MKQEEANTWTISLTLALCCTGEFAGFGSSKPCTHGPRIAVAPMDLGVIGDGPMIGKALRFPGDLSCLTLLALISSDAHALLGVGSASRKRCIFLGDSLGCSSSKLSLRKTQQRLCRHMSKVLQDPTVCWREGHELC